MITADEDAMLSTLRLNLGISDSRHASLLAELLDGTSKGEKYGNERWSMKFMTIGKSTITNQ